MPSPHKTRVALDLTEERTLFTFNLIMQRILRIPARVSLLTALAVLVAACSSQDGSGPVPEPQGVEVTLTSSSDVASQSSPLTVTVTVTNHGTEKTSYGQGSSSCRTTLVVRVNDSDQGASEPRMCTADIMTYELNPGESYSEDWEWGGAYYTDRLVPLEPGGYEL